MADQLLGLIGSEIVGWIVAGVLGLMFGGLLKWWWPQYKDMKRRLAALEKDKLRLEALEEAFRGGMVIYGGVHIGRDPPSKGHVVIERMTQAEYDALPVKDKNTLYLISEPNEV